MREISPLQLADIIENNAGSPVAIAELRRIVLEEGAVLIHNDIRIASIIADDEGNYILQPTI